MTTPATRAVDASPVVPTVVTGHFACGADYATWRPAGTGDWLLIHTLGGAGRFGRKPLAGRVEAGSAALLPPGAPHDYGTDPEAGGWDLLWAHFHPRPGWMDLLRWPGGPAGAGGAGGPGSLRLDDPAFAADLRRMHGAATGAGRWREQWAMNALEAYLLRADGLNPASAASRVDPRVRDAMDHACRNLRLPLSAADLAAVAGLSVSRFEHLFAEQVGQTPQRYVERQRLDRAAQLLRSTAMDVGAVARDVGFADPFYLSRRFRRQFGVSPRAYRQRG